MIFLECLFGLLNFIPAGGKPGIVTVWITLFPNIVQKLRGSGQACCAFQVAEYAIRQIVFGKELIGLPALETPIIMASAMSYSEVLVPSSCSRQ